MTEKKDGEPFSPAVNVAYFFRFRKEVIDTYQTTMNRFDRNLEEISKELFDLVPSELELFKSLYLCDFKGVKALLEDINRSGKKVLLIDFPQKYGFDSMSEAEAKLVLLEEAWAGKLNIKVIRTQAWYERYGKEIPAAVDSRPKIIFELPSNK